MRAKWTPRVAASNLSQRASRHRAGHRARHAPPAAEPGRSRHLRGGRRGHRGEQGQRRRRRQTRLWRDGLRAGHQSGHRREPDRRHVACTGRAWRCSEEVQFNQTNVTSLDWNTYQTLRFGEHPGRHADRRPAAARAEQRRGRGSAAGGGRRDRQRVLRCDGRENPAVSVDAAARAGGAQVRV